MGNYDKRQQLNEYVQVSDANQIEQVNDKGVKEKHWYLNGIFMQGEIENLNGRIYPRSEIEYAVDSLKAKIEAAKQGKGPVLMGELDHPDSLVVEVKNASHIIEDIRMEGNDGVGKMRILSSTPNGKIVEGLLSEGIPLGVSTRGSGEVDDYTNMVSNGPAYVVVIERAGCSYCQTYMPIMEDDANEKQISRDSLTGRKNVASDYTVNIPQGFILAKDNNDGTNYKWSVDKNIKKIYI